MLLDVVSAGSIVTFKNCGLLTVLTVNYRCDPWQSLDQKSFSMVIQAMLEK